MALKRCCDAADLTVQLNPPPPPPPICHDQVLVNDGLEEAYAELKETAMAWYPQLKDDIKTPTEA